MNDLISTESIDQSLYDSFLTSTVYPIGLQDNESGLSFINSHVKSIPKIIWDSESEHTKFNESISYFDIISHLRQRDSNHLDSWVSFFQSSSDVSLKKSLVDNVISDAIDEKYNQLMPLKRHEASVEEQNKYKSKLKNIRPISHHEELSTFVAENEWNGIVLDIDNDEFYAQFIELNTLGVNGEYIDFNPQLEQGWFKVSSVSKHTKDLLNIGARFVWSIGYIRSYKGTKKLISKIDIRRNPVWTQESINKIKDIASKRVDAIKSMVHQIPAE